MMICKIRSYVALCLASLTLLSVAVAPVAAATVAAADFIPIDPSL